MKRWLVRIALGLVGLVVLIVAGGAVYEALSRRADARRFPPPGRMVDIGGRRIQIDCRGSGTPVVVFESGLDTMGSLSWAAVQPEVARTTRACAYSRAGVMWSDPSTGPFSADAEARDLHEALSAAGEKPPYVIVAHSLGGPYAANFTRLYGADVAGLVFVDASHPDQLAVLRAAAGRDVNEDNAQVRIADALSWAGVVRLATAREPPHPPHTPPAVIGPLQAKLPTSLHAVLREGDAIAATLAAAGRQRTLGARPIVVLTHGAAPSAAALKAMKVTPAQSARMDAAWLGLQNDMAHWSTHGRHEVVAGATHYIQLDRPAVVVAAVREVVSDVRDAAPGPAPPL